MSLKTIRSVSLATLGAVLLTVVGCAPAPSAPPAAGGKANALPTNGPPSTDPAAAKPAAADDQAGSTTGATESAEK